MKKLLIILLLVFGFHSYAQISGQPSKFPKGIKLQNATEDSTAIRIPVMQADGTINNYILKSNLGGGGSGAPQGLDSVLATDNEAWTKWLNVYGVVLPGGFYNRYYTDSTGLHLQFLTDFTNPADPAGFILNAASQTVFQHAEGNKEAWWWRYQGGGDPIDTVFKVDTVGIHPKAIVLPDGYVIDEQSDLGTGGTDAATVDSIAFYNKFRILSAADNGSNILTSDEDKALIAESDSVYLVLPAGLGTDSVSFMSLLGLGNAEWVINSSAVTLEYNGDTVAEANFQQAQLMHVWGDYYKLYKVDTTGGAVFTPLTKEQVQDFVGEMFINNTEERVDIDYDDINDEFDVVVNPDLALYDNTNSGFAYDVDVVKPGDDNTLFTNGAGYLISESDPVFTGSDAAGITSGDIADWNSAFAIGDFRDYGLGANTAGVPSGDADSIKLSGFYSTSSGTLNTPGGTGVIVHYTRSSIVAFQMYYRSNGEVSVRFMNTTWGAWSKLYSELEFDIADYATAAALTTHTSNTSNPHSVTAAQVGSYTTAQSDANLATQTARIDKLYFPKRAVGSSFTFSADEIWTRVYNLGAGGISGTIPFDFTDMVIGDQIILQAIGGDIDISAASGVTLNGVSAGSVTISSPYAARVLEKIADNEYVIYIN